MSIKRGNLIWIEPPLASGGMAEAWRVINRGAEGVQSIHVVKRILLNYASNVEFKKMFIDEAKITSQLHKPIPHPNIIQVVEFQQFEDEYLLFLEYINGPDLRNILSTCSKRKIKFPIEYTLFMISEVLNGLYHAHTLTDMDGNNMNIIHRDISPQNILVSYGGDVKIIDWGIADAKMKSTETVVGIIKGKYGYMSPEQANAEDLDFRSDMYSTAVVLWEMLTGRRLFVHENDLKTLKKIQKSEIESPKKYNKDISKNLVNIVFKALSRKRDKRYKNSLEFSQALIEERNRIAADFNKIVFADFLKKLFAEEIKKDQLILSQAEAKIPSAVPPQSPSMSRPPAPRRRTITQQKARRTSPPRRPSGIYDNNQLDTSNIELENHRTGSKSYTPESYAMIQKKAEQERLAYKERTQSHTWEQSEVNLGFRKLPFVFITLILMTIGGIWYIKNNFELSNPMTILQNMVSQNGSAHTGRTLEIRSPEKDLTITVVGNTYHKTSAAPLIVKNLPARTLYFVEISKIGFETIARSVSINDNSTHILQIDSMVPVSARGNLFLESVPSGANIFVNGIKTNKLTPNTIALPVGRKVAVRLSRHGYSDYKFKVELDDEEELLKKKIVLSGTRRIFGSKKVPAIIKIESEPNGATVLLNYEPVCQTPCDFGEAYIGDTVKLVFDLNGYHRHPVTFKIKKSENYIKPTLKIMHGGYGYLSLKSIPHGNIYINGKPIGRKTPLYKYKLKPGKHKVKVSTWSSGDKLSYEKIINIPAGASIKKNFVLQ